MDVMMKREKLKQYCRTLLHGDVNCCERCVMALSKDVCGVNIMKAPDEQIETWYARAFPETPTPCTASVDYEAEYHKLLAENAKLMEEIKYMQMGARELRENNDILRAKLDMVYLIFGGSNR